MIFLPDMKYRTKHKNNRSERKTRLIRYITDSDILKLVIFDILRGKLYLGQLQNIMKTKQLLRMERRKAEMPHEKLGVELHAKSIGKKYVISIMWSWFNGGCRAISRQLN